MFHYTRGDRFHMTNTTLISMGFHNCLNKRNTDGYCHHHQKQLRSKTFLRLRTYTGEEQSSQSSIHNVQNPVTDEDAEDAQDYQDHQTDEKHTVTGREVILGLWKESKTDVTLVTIMSGCDQRP